MAMDFIDETHANEEVSTAKEEMEATPDDGEDVEKETPTKTSENADDTNLNDVVLAAVTPASNTASTSATKVSSKSLKKLCSESCVMAFAKIKEANELLSQQAVAAEKSQFQRINDLEKKLKSRETEISKLKTELLDTKAQHDLLKDKYLACKSKLDDTQVNCEKWVESCKGYQMLLSKQSASNVKFGIGYNHTEPACEYKPRFIETGDESLDMTQENKACFSVVLKTTENSAKSAETKTAESNNNKTIEKSVVSQTAENPFGKIPKETTEGSKISVVSKTTENFSDVFKSLWNNPSVVSQTSVVSKSSAVFPNNSALLPTPGVLQHHQHFLTWVQVSFFALFLKFPNQQC